MENFPQKLRPGGVGWFLHAPKTPLFPMMGTFLPFRAEKGKKDVPRNRRFAAHPACVHCFFRALFPWGKGCGRTELSRDSVLRSRKYCRKYYLCKGNLYLFRLLSYNIPGKYKYTDDREDRLP